MQLAENTRFRPGDTGRPNADGVDPPGVADCQARPGELVDQRHQPHAPAVIGSTFDKVEAPDMMEYSGRSRMQDPSLSQSLLLIASRTRAIDASSAVGSIDEALGPHCAVKRILYANGSRGVLLYFKSSLTGDEQDYILDYKKRNPASPHKQRAIFSEEQFDAYRALGFHMVEHFFDQDDKFDYLTEGEGDGAFENAQEARAAILPGLRRLP